MANSTSSAPDEPRAAEIGARLQRAIDHHQRGQRAEAERLYREILTIVPGHFDALHLLGVAATQRGNHEEAVELIQAAIAANPGQAAAHSNLGLALHKCGRLTEALASFDRALALNADSVAALYNRGNVLRELRRPGEALASYDRALALRPDDTGVLCNRGNALRELARPAEALASYDRSLAHKPDDPDALLNRGLALIELDRPLDALASLDRALAGKPGDADAHFHRGNALRMLNRHDDAVASYDRALLQRRDLIGAINNRGIALQQLKRPHDALASFDRALAIDPGNAQVLNNRGNALAALRRQDEALASYERAIAVDPDYVDALNNRGNVLRDLMRHAEALSSYDRVLSRRPGHVDALLNRGNVLRDLGRPVDALASYDLALSLRPDNVPALYNRGKVLQDLRRYGDAAEAFAQVVALAPDHDYAIGSLHECRLNCCDWTDAALNAGKIVAAVAEGRRVVMPFAFLAISPTPEAQLACARTFIADRYPPSPDPLWRGERYEHERIRVAYLSADLREHPVAYLMAELFERHDRRRFETVAVSLGSAGAGAMRRRLERAFDRFLDVRQASDGEVAAMLRELEIDIAVDLNGITAQARTGILARRPAPVQVNYLGYPGSMGAGYIDYLIADRYVIPEGQRGQYAEQVVYLPETFQANDATRRLGEPGPTRAGLGLPGEGFVFCSFNNSYKITPAMFAVWLRLLRRVAGSVLWLVGGNAAVEANLRREAAGGGVEPGRVVFAPRVGYAEHLARSAVADLFLDTLPFNGGTTASDALWAGLPVLSCSGEAFAARMAGSLLRAVGLPELITTTLAEYEARAYELATEAGRLAGIRERLERNRLTAPLFDSERFRRHLEAAYVGMWQRYQRGEPPAAFAVEPAA